MNFYLHSGNWQKFMNFWKVQNCILEIHEFLESGKLHSGNHQKSKNVSGKRFCFSESVFDIWKLFFNIWKLKTHFGNQLSISESGSTIPESKTYTWNLKNGFWKLKKQTLGNQHRYSEYS
jgi:hypothetical protein